MKKFKLLALMIIALVMSSCTTVQKTSTTVDITPYVMQTPTVADLEISTEKVSKTIEWSGIFSTTSFSQRKRNLTADILLENNADVLVDLQYVYEKSLFGTSRLTVFGFPAKYKNFRVATPADYEALKAGYPGVCLVSDAYDGNCENMCTAGQKKKDKKKFSLGSLFGGKK